MGNYLYRDSRLQPENFKLLKDLNSREQIKINPTTGKSGYTPGGDNEITFTLQNHSAFMDPLQTYLHLKVENKRADKYIWSDSLGTLANEVKILQGNQIVEQISHGARLFEHLVLATSSQSYYDFELNALQKSYAFRSWNRRYTFPGYVNGYDLNAVAAGSAQLTDKDAQFQAPQGTGNSRTLECMLHLDHLAFFRSKEFKPLFIDYQFQFTLPDANHVLQLRNGATQNGVLPDYEVKLAQMEVSLIYPDQSVLDEVYHRMNDSEEGLSYILDDSVEVFLKPLDDSAVNDIILNASLSNLQGMVAFVVPTQNSVNADNVAHAPLSGLKEYSLSLMNQDIAVRGGVAGLEDAYAQYRKLYNSLGDISGVGMLDWDRFVNYHTPLCISSEILRDSPPGTLRNSLNTLGKGSQVAMHLEMDSNNPGFTNSHLLIYLFNKRICTITQSTVSIGF